MSQYVKVNAKVLDSCKPAILEEALEKMGLKINKNLKEVFGYNKQDHGEVDYTIIFPNHTSAEETNTVGIKYERDKYYNTSATILGDFWRTGYSQQQFMKQLLQKYQEININDIQLNQYGGQLLERRELSNGDVQLVYSFA
jgi:hypothetical protein